MVSRGSGTELFIDFGMILGAFLESFLRTEAWNSNFRSGLFQVNFASAFKSKFGRLGLLNPCFRMQCITKIDFSQKSRFIDFGGLFL